MKNYFSGFLEDRSSIILMMFLTFIHAFILQFIETEIHRCLVSFLILGFLLCSLKFKPVVHPSFPLCFIGLVVITFFIRSFSSDVFFSDFTIGYGFIVIVLTAFSNFFYFVHEDFVGIKLFRGRTYFGAYSPGIGVKHPLARIKEISTLPQKIFGVVNFKFEENFYKFNYEMTFSVLRKNSGLFVYNYGSDYTHLLERQNEDVMRTYLEKGPNLVLNSENLTIFLSSELRGKLKNYLYISDFSVKNLVSTINPIYDEKNFAVCD